MDRRNVPLGLLGVFGIWVTAGLALPAVNILKFIPVEQLMVVRGFVTAIVVYVLLGGKVLKLQRNTLFSGLGFAGGCLGLYHGIRELGPSITIIILTTAPVVNFVLAWRRKKQVSVTAILSLVIMLIGVSCALKWTRTPVSVTGIFWSVFGCISGALYYEALARAKTEGNRMTRCFWQALVVAIVGTLGTVVLRQEVFVPDFQVFVLLVIFALLGGFLYFLSNIEAFTHLPLETASVLAQGETPAVIIMADVMLGEKLTSFQWGGVIVALCGAAYLSIWVARSEKTSS